MCTYKPLVLKYARKIKNYAFNTPYNFKKKTICEKNVSLNLNLNFYLLIII